MELSSLDRGHFRALIIGAGQAGLAVTATGPDATSTTITTDVLLNATGTWNNPHVPHIPGIETFRGRQLHTKDYTRKEDFAGLRTLVVGGGLSAVQFLLELQEVSETIWANPRAPRWMPTSSSGTQASATPCATSHL